MLAEKCQPVIEKVSAAMQQAQELGENPDEQTDEEEVVE
jgi:hypothetical protein